jgi:hypothetical protein
MATTLIVEDEQAGARYQQQDVPNHVQGTKAKCIQQHEETQDDENRPRHRIATPHHVRPPCRVSMRDGASLCLADVSVADEA